MRCPAPGCGALVTVPPSPAAAAPAPLAQEGSVLGDLDGVGLEDHQPLDSPAPPVPPPEARWNALLDYTQPTLYHGNPFRVLRLGVRASEAEARGKAEQLLRNRVALSLDVDEALIRQALGALRRPETRLLAECFWFWPLRPDGGPDEALACLDRKDAAAAEALWMRERKRRDLAGICTHNLAVLHHGCAVELERTALEHPLGQQERQDLPRHWKLAGQHFKTLLADDSFWHHFEARGRQLGLADAAKRCRGTLPLALVALHGRLALDWAARGKVAAVKAHAEYLKAAGFGEDAVALGLSEALAKATKRVRSLCAGASRDAGADPLHADQVVAEFLDRAEAYLALLQVVPGQQEDDPQESAPRPLALVPEGNEEVAAADLPLAEVDVGHFADPTKSVVWTALDCLGKYGRKTEQWDVVLRNLARLRALDVRGVAESLIQTTQHSALQRRDSGDGWCVDGYFSLDARLLRPLERARQEADRENWDDAIERLEHLREALPDGDGPGAEEAAVCKPLAYCLHCSITPLLGKAEKRVRRPIPILACLDASRLEQIHRGFGRRLAYLEGPGEDGKMPPPPCALCDEEGGAYEADIEGTEMALCYSCAKRLIAEVEEYNRWMKSSLRRIDRALTRANELAPENRVVLGKLQRLEALQGHRVRVQVKRRRKKSLLDDLEDLEDLAEGLADLLGDDD